jgi:hypothetical protein
MLKRLTLPLGLALALLAGTALAADPNAHQIYLALKGGHVAQAQQMIEQVLRDHPGSAKAHFVAAEIDARASNFGLARQQLAKAESIAPGLPFASAEAVRELRRQLGQAPGAGLARSPSAHRHGSNLGWALLLIGGVIVVWMIVRRRMAAASYTAYPGQAPGGMPPGGPAGPMGPGGYPPGGAPGYGPGGGSGLLGGLGTGLAMGAGMAAGEGLVDHLLGGNPGGGMIPDANAGQPIDPQVNADMGGNDFGMSDPGSWDDGSGDAGDDGGGWT